MELSQGEKLILLMLSEIYDQLEVKGDTDTKFIRNTIYSGHLWALKWKLSGIPSGSMPEAVADEVSNILAMWEYIEHSYDRLPPEDQARVRESVNYWPTQGKFRGFDGNDEGQHHSVAKFLVDEMGSFEHFKKRDLNSHAGTLAGYRNMLPLYTESMPESLQQGWGFSADQLIELLKRNA